ncbi:hypothetical protein SISSUDRAFT_1029322 [Sistotremastrum suecicum HHB10207 ss-3]|uniref:FUN14-domain-containing protein n=1 Tax=Sistotremastrum suecicum HHB10207 ss-3 TaxID=1314776 RepID=A0A166IT93_9AGAM|nr:hypothetical protein SISSUDRAFT_1029322 [Sistotremastrum suecicum HHB10207 ss-3]
MLSSHARIARPFLSQTCLSTSRLYSSSIRPLSLRAPLLSKTAIARAPGRLAYSTQSAAKSLKAGRWVAFVGLAGLSAGAVSAHNQPIVQCEAPSIRSPAQTPPPPTGPAPESIINVYELSFGTVAGICSGIFIKKGAKALAFCIGGVFVLLQYFGSLSLVRVDWARMSQKFENLFYTTEANGLRRPPTIVSLWRWLVDFLTADFQPRASFLAGLALGLRVG